MDKVCRVGVPLLVWGGVLASLALKNVPSSYVDFVLNGGP
jgi:hypothetical protein